MDNTRGNFEESQKILDRERLLSNSSLSLVRLGVDFVLPLSQQQEEQEPPPKSTRRKCTTDLKIGTET